jgi:hypothetical protein
LAARLNPIALNPFMEAAVRPENGLSPRTPCVGCPQTDRRAFLTRW